MEKALHAVDHSVVFHNRNHTGKLALTGQDTVDLLNRISTNSISNANQSDDTIFLDNKGRFIDYCKVLYNQDMLLLLTQASSTAHLIDWIDKYVFIEDVHVNDVTGQYCLYLILGPDSRDFLSETGLSPAANTNEMTLFELAGIKCWMIPDREFSSGGSDAYNLLAEKKHSEVLETAIARFVKKKGGMLLNERAYETVRIRQRVPLYGSEITSDFNPLEAGLEHAIDFHKGCYIGQEVVARLDSMKRVKRHLAQIKLSGEKPERLPVDIYYKNEVIGIITSVDEESEQDTAYGLGYVKNKFLPGSNSDITVSIDRKKNQALIV